MELPVTKTNGIEGKTLFMNYFKTCRISLTLLLPEEQNCVTFEHRSSITNNSTVNDENISVGNQTGADFLPCSLGPGLKKWVEFFGGVQWSASEQLHQDLILLIIPKTPTTFQAKFS